MNGFFKILDRVFLLKRIESKDGELHFQRWGVETFLGNIYLHAIYVEDKDEHYHDHPWNYISICLKDFFIESSKVGKFLTREKVVWRGSIIRRKAEVFHKIRWISSKRPIYTLFFTGRRKREWGYDVDGTWIDHVTYRRMKNSGAFTKKD